MTSIKTEFTLENGHIRMTFTKVPMESRPNVLVFKNNVPNKYLTVKENCQCMTPTRGMIHVRYVKQILIGDLDITDKWTEHYGIYSKKEIGLYEAE